VRMWGLLWLFVRELSLSVHVASPPYVPSVLPRCHLRSIWYRLYRPAGRRSRLYTPDTIIWNVMRTESWFGFCRSPADPPPTSRRGLGDTANAPRCAGHAAGSADARHGPMWSGHRVLTSRPSCFPFIAEFLRLAFRLRCGFQQIKSRQIRREWPIVFSRRVFVDHHAAEQSEAIGQLGVHGPPFLTAGTVLAFVPSHAAINRNRLRRDVDRLPVVDRTRPDWPGINVRSTQSQCRLLLGLFW